jgi:hypothetical protein
MRVEGFEKARQYRDSNWFRVQDSDVQARIRAGLAPTSKGSPRSAGSELRRGASEEPARNRRRKVEWKVKLLG